jgi:hypothetical protein
MTDKSDLDLNRSDEELRDRIRDLIALANSQRSELREIVGQDFIYREHPRRQEFKLQTYDLHIEHSERGEDTADFNFLPRGVIHSREIPKSEHFRFKSESISSFILGCESLIKFLKEHPDTRLGKISKFYGETNSEMANFLKKRLNLESIKVEGESDLYLIVFYLEDLVKGLAKFRSEHPQVATVIDRSRKITA